MKPIEIIIGRGNPNDPNSGDSVYNNPSLAGQDLWVEVYGSGPYPYEDYSVLPTGGFQLLNGLKFGSNGQQWFVHVSAYVPQLSSLTGITNGYNIQKVMTVMQGRIGWKQPTLSGMPVISGQNQSSTSGRYYADFHTSCTIQKIYAAQEDKDISTADFNALLYGMDQSVIMRSLNAIFNRPQLIEHGLVYERMSNIRAVPVPNQGNFCGYRIKVSSGDYSVMINTLALYFNGVSTFNIYLFNDLTAAPLKTQSVTTVANSQTVVNLDWIISYISDNKGGLFYIGYFQNDLGSVQAIDEQLNMWDASKIFGAWPFQSLQIGSLDFNRINPSVVFRTYGLNMEMSSYRDFTQTITQNAHLFDEARGLCMAIQVLELIKNSSRTNSTERQANEMSKIEYDVNLAFPTKEYPFMAGLKSQLAREFQRINQGFFPKAEAQIFPVGGFDDYGYLEYDSFDITNLPPRERVN